MAAPTGFRNLLSCGLFQIDLQSRQIYKSGRKVPLQEQPLQVLEVLLERPGQLVTRDELKTRIWPGVSFVSFDEGINTAIRKLRLAFGDSAENPRFIETIPRKGYRFIAPVSMAEPPVVASPAREASAPGATRPSRESGGFRRLKWILIPVLLGLPVAGYLFRKHQPVKSPSTRMMLAVLPFQNLSGDPRQDYFSDGLTEETITDLGQVNPDTLGVVARTSAMAYKHTNKTVAQIASELGVDYILEGSVRREGNEVRISAQLIQVKDQTHLWAHNYQRQIDDILSIEDELGMAIAREVQGNLRPQVAGTSKPRAVNPEAYDLYLKGRFYWNERTPAGIRESVGYFRSALTKDPEFAQAFAGLADAYNIGNIIGAFTAKESFPEVEAAASQALKLDPSLAEAHAALGVAKSHYEFDFPGAEKEFRRAIELDPNSAYAHLFYSNCYLAPMGKMAEAISENQRALELDPLSLPINNFMAMTYLFAGEYENSYRQFQRTIAMDPAFPLSHLYFSFLLKINGKFDQGIEEEQKAELLTGSSPEEATQKARLITEALRTKGEQGAWQKELELYLAKQKLHKSGAISPGLTAAMYAVAGNKDRAFEWLDKAYAERDGEEITLLKEDPVFKNLRDDPRFAALLRKMGLPS